MKIYFADTIQSEYLGHRQKLHTCNNLESFFAIKTKMKNSSIKDWSMFNDPPSQPQRIQPSRRIRKS